MDARVLHLADELGAMVMAAAARAYPSECCGLIEGIDTGGGWRALAIHETANLAGDPARGFLVDPSVQFALLRALRDSGRRVIGCFHSHPNGAAGPSDADREAAAEDDFLWLIAAGDTPGAFSLAAYVFAAEGKIFREVTLRP